MATITSGYDGSQLDYSDLLGSPEYSGDGTRASVKTTGIIAGDDFSKWYLALFPPPTSNGIVPFPMILPDNGSAILSAKSFSAKPEFTEQTNSNQNSPTSFRNTYKTMTMEVTWENLPFVNYNHSLVTWRMKAGTQATPLPASSGGLFWGDVDPTSSGAVINLPDVVGFQPISVNDLEIKVWRSPTLPAVAVGGTSSSNMGYKGSINSGNIGSSGCFFSPLTLRNGNSVSPLYFAPGTLMYMDADVEPYYSPNGGLVFDYVLRFKHRCIAGTVTKFGTSQAGPIDWTCFFDPLKGIWRPVVTKVSGSATPLFPSNDFSGLIP